MNKKILFFSLILSFAVVSSANAFTTASSGYMNHEVNPENYIVNTDNNLVLDVSLPNPISDTALSGLGTPIAGSVIITINPWSEAVVPVFFYDNGDNIWTSANDGIFTDDDSSGTYTVGDTRLAGSGTPTIDSAIITTNPWASASLPIFFYDNDNTVWASGGDGIFQDVDGSGYYNGDKISSIRLTNVALDGPATDNEIDAIKIWQENDSATGFQTGSDILIGSKTSAPYWDQAITCSSAVVYTSTSKNRIYITVDISPKAINKRIIKGSIPTNSLLFVSTSDGPIGTNIISNSTHTIFTGSILDQLKPTSNIDNISTSTVIIANQPFTITGISADTGGSNVQKVEISFNNGITWAETTPLIAQNNGYTWKYIWSNPLAGAYTLKTRATDWIGNEEIPSTGIVVTINVLTQTGTATSTTSTTTIETFTSTTQNTNDQLIMTLQLRLIELLKQLIELLKARL